MTPNQIELDTSLFLFSILLGFFTGFYFEIFRFFRLAFPHRNVLVFLEDLAFFLPVTLIFLLFTFAFSDGTVRWFSVFGFWMGFFLYLGTVGRVLRFFSDRILRFIRFLLRFVFRLTVAPLLKVIKKVTKSLFIHYQKQAIIRKQRMASRLLEKQKLALLHKAEHGFIK